MDFSTYKAFLFDVDKTLTSSAKKISQRTVTMLTNLAIKDRVIGVATGRSYATLAPILRHFPADARHILAGGAVVMDSLGNEYYQENIRSELTEEIIALSGKYAGNVVISAGKQIYSDREEHSYPSLMGEQIRVQNIGDLHDRNVPIITIYQTTAALQNALDSLPSISCKTMTTYDGSEYVDITAAGVTKSTGIAAWCQMMQLEASQIVGFGDSENDREFLNTVGYSVAMGNATDAIKEIADAVTLDCDHDGVAVWVERNLHM